MTTVSDFQDIKALIDNLYENNSEVLNESLQRLILVLQSNQKEDIIYHLESLFEKFPILLLDENLSVIVQTSQLLIELITQLAKETEQYFTLVLENLIMNLADSKPVIRKMAFNSLSSFIQMTKNYDLVYTGLIQYGILHANPQTRQKCINAINNFMLSDSSCINTSSAFRQVIEKLIEKSTESIDSVRSAAYQVITNLNSHHKAAFSSLIKRLSYSDQEKIRMIIESPDSANMESQESTPVNNNSHNTSKSPLRPYDMKQETEKSTTPRKNSDITDSPNRVPKNFKMTTKKTSFAPLQTGKQLLRFGLFEHRVIDDAGVQDWRTRLAATEDILKTIEGLDNTHVIVPYLGEFFDLLVLLLNDVNFKICINSLNIIGITFKLTSKEDLSSHIGNVVSVLLGKLGDSKVAVRQIAFQILAGAAKKMDTQELLTMVFTRLKENNWHMREECLLLTQMVFNSSTEEFPISFYEETVENMIEALDDQKPKVRNTARETIINVLRHYSQPMHLLNTIQPLLEKELYEYMLFRIQNPENFPRNNYTPYTEDSTMEPRDVLGMTGNMSGKGDMERLSDNDYRGSANAHFRSMTTSPRDPNIMMAQNPNLRQHNEAISSASPYRRQNNNYDPNHSQIANTTGYSNSSSNTYFGGNTAENSRYGNRNLNMGTPYEKRNYDGDNSPVISNFGTPYTKNSVHTPESQQRLGNSYNNQSGYYPKVHTPYQGQKGLYEISTASSSRSTYSRNTNTIYSFEASSISNSSGVEKAKFAKQNPMSYTNMLDSRINSAQVNTDLSPGVYGRDKRTYSAAEEQNKSGLQNKLSSKKAAVPNSDTYLEYSITKKLDDFISSNFDGQGTLDQQFPKVRQGEVFSSIDSFQTTDSQSYQQIKQGNSANPYRGTRPDLAQKLKKLQAQQPPIILEADETKRTTKKETSDTTNDRLKEKKPPLPLHKRGVSQNNRNDFEKTTEKDNESSSDDDNSFSIKNNAPSKTLKKKATAKPSEALTIPEYKKLDYLTKDQLEPIEGNIEGTIRVMNNELKSDDWQKQFEASNNLRRLIQFHCSHLVNSANFNLHSTTQDVLRMVESLRSNLAKNGLITLTEMCCALKRQMDSEADTIYVKLIKKGSDANSFISEEVKRALIAVSQNCSDTKVIPILLSMFQQKAIPAKINLALCCEAVITKNENRVNQLRDFDKIVIVLGNYILDSANEVRNASKQAMSTLINFLFSKSELDKILQRQFTEANLNRINAIISKELSQGNSTLMITNLQATGKNKSAPAKPKLITSKSSVDDEEEKVESKPLMRTREYKEARESTDSKESPLLSTSDKPKKAIKAGARDPRDYEDLQGIFTQADASDWKTRYDAANALAEFGRKHCETLPRSKLVHKYMDYFTKLMQDSNTKVSSSAISAFIDMIPELRPSIESNMTTVSNASLALLGSVNPSIKSAAENLFETLSDRIDPSVLIPSWTNSLPFTNVKAKIAILSKLNEIASGLYSKKPILITKNVIPVISKCIEETKAEIRNATHQLFQTLYSFMNRDLLDYVPANKSQIVFDIVAGK